MRFFTLLAVGCAVLSASTVSGVLAATSAPDAAPVSGRIAEPGPINAKPAGIYRAFLAHAARVEDGTATEADRAHVLELGQKLRSSGADLSKIINHYVLQGPGASETLALFSCAGSRPDSALGDLRDKRSGAQKFIRRRSTQKRKEEANQDDSTIPSTSAQEDRAVPDEAISSPHPLPRFVSLVQAFQYGKLPAVRLPELLRTARQLTEQEDVSPTQMECIISGSGAAASVARRRQELLKMLDHDQQHDQGMHARGSQQLRSANCDDAQRHVWKRNMGFRMFERSF